jgi:predicted metal-dependent phosphoesterase TrpH
LRYDLHAHTNASDGVCSPEELVRLARKAGLQGLAVTDHDTVAGVAAAEEAAAELGLELIPGIELSIQTDAQDIHVLGYWIDHRAPELRAALAELFTMRERRVRTMLDKLADLGYALDYEEVSDQVGGGIPGRPHVARALVARGYVEYGEEAFERFIGNDGPAYVPKSLMDPERGFALLRRFGAVPVLAHPGLTDYPRFLDRFIALGLAGLEVDHPKHDLVARAELRALCRERDLVATGGSDYHFPGPPHRDLGSQGVSGETLAALRARRPR